MCHESFHFFFVFHAVCLNAAAHIQGKGLERCRLGGIVRIEAAGQKVRSVYMGQQGPVETVPGPAGTVVEQDVVGPAAPGLPDIGFAGDGKGFDDPYPQGLLDSFEHMVERLASRIGAFRATALVGLMTTGLSCNQTLSIILTRQLCAHAQHNRREMAMYLENSVVLLSAVLPWSIAFSMCSLTLQQGAAIIPFALYLWMVPLYWCLQSRKVHQSCPRPLLQFFLAKKTHRD